ncbi:MAG: hypothetical protein AAF564_00115 [Bacteroidota bacterium]
MASCLGMGCGELRPTHDDARKAFSELLLVQEAHQKSIADLILAEAPAYQAIVARDTALVLDTWRRRQLQFEYLLNSDPDRLRLRRGREGMVSFGWTEEDAAQLSRETPRYEQLEQAILSHETWLAAYKMQDADAVAFFDDMDATVAMRNLRRVYGRDEQAIVLRYRLSAILKEE